MKIIKIILITLGALVPLTIEAQIEDEIKAYVDTTELIVLNGRKLMIKSVQENDFEKIAEIYDYLVSTKSTNNCDVFSYDEDVFTYLLIGDWNSFLTKAEKYSTEINKPLCYRLNDRLGNYLFDEIEKQWDILKEDLYKASLSDEEHFLIETVIYLIGNGQNDEYYAKIKAFKKNFPKSKFNAFVNGFLPRDVFRGFTAMPFGMGAAQIFPNGKLHNFFDQATVFSITMDYCFDKWFGGLQVTGGDIALRKDLLGARTGYMVDFYSGSHFDYMNVGFELGYQVLKKKRFHIAPYLYLGGTTLMSDLFEGEDNDDLEFQVINSFFAGTGLRLEYKIVDLVKEETTTAPVSSLALRLDAGYNYPVSFKFSPARGGIAYSRLSLIWYLGYY